MIALALIPLFVLALYAWANWKSEPMMTEKTCAERIGAHKTSRLDDFARLAAAATSDSETLIDGEWITSEQASDRIYEYPLAVSTFRTWRIDLSTGGPGDWLEVQTDSEGDPTRVEYHFNDWFDHASVTLDGEERDIALAFADSVTAGFYTEAA